MQTEPSPAGQARKSSFWADLRVVAAEPDFRKLFTIRLVSSTAGGVFSAGFTTYVFFSASTFPNPLAAVEAFAVLYLPFSLIGPFVGVFIDRWSRRQILIWAGLLQAALVAVASLVILSGQTQLPFYISVLATLGAGRFFASALSASTPRVVAADKLVMANAVAPTSGTIASLIGGLIGLGMRPLVGQGHAGSAITLLVSAAFYVIAGLLGLRIARNLLGPDREPGATSAERGITGELADVARGLGSALRHLAQRRKAAYALGSIGAHHALYGVLLVQALLLYRNYLYPGNGDAALQHASALVATSAVGFGLAAVITPLGTKWLPMNAWITAWLAVAAVATLALGPTFSQAPFLAMGFIMGLSAQCVKICVDTTVQQVVADQYRGRVFSIYDMLYNVTYVIGPAIALPFLPANGKSYLVVTAIGIGYVLAAAAYAALTLRPARTGGSPPEPGSPPPRPTAVAQR
ncbi:MAG TPA: MFS transporter [Trebonia sp.]|nr:MFS transporter [Trebonia sp.]